ncbi:MAG TPA: Mur ligase domain-containing protein [Methylomirabilota bacterium]|nr:Mur ligase domain-containing protein [Methylomirabilota bacterium]
MSPRYHFSGVGGAGMGPLARLMRARGHSVQGSDRAFDAGRNREAADALRAAGVELVAHDGRGVTRALDRFVYSTAVEADTPEMRAAREAGVAMMARPALLAELVDTGRPGVAISGTSGKSTITGMLAWLARESDARAAVIGGAALVGEGGGGCLVPGPTDAAVVAEADESDGTLVGYHPAIGLIHNVSRDHTELELLRKQFATFAAQSGRLFVNARCPEASALAREGTVSYGVAPAAAAPVRVGSLGPERATGALRWRGADVTLEVPQPGLHNLENAAAAALVALELGIPAAEIARLLPRFPGVARRFQMLGVTRAGIRVIDDFAHNGEKIRAALTTAQAGAARVVAVFQPHGYGPARFLRGELRELLPGLLRPADRFCYAEIFYAGGTVTKDVSSRDLAADIGCAYAADHAAVARWVASEARPGDTVLLMGARDPDLPRLARDVLAALGG